MNRLLLLILLAFSSFSLSAQSLRARFNVSAYSGCLADTFRFTNQSVDANQTAWHWTFGDGSASTLQSPTHAYTQKGVMVVSLKVFNSSGDSSLAYTDTVYILPIAEVPYNRYYLCGSPIQIRSTASDNPFLYGSSQTYSWTGGTTTPSMMVSTPGVYTLTVSGSCGTAYTDSVVVRTATGNTAITPKSLSEDSVRPGGLTTVLAASLIYRDEEYGYTHWNWGDGTTSQRNAVWQPLAHTYAKPGKYTVTCSVTLNNNVRQASCGDTIASYQVTVSDTNVVRAKIGILKQDCNTVTFVDSSYTLGSGDITSKEWNMGDGADSNLVHTYQRDSTYTVRLIVRNFYTGQNDTAYRTVKIQTQPTVKLIPDTIIALGTHLTLKNLLPETGSYTYKWSTGDTTSSISVYTQNYYSLLITSCGKSAYDSVFVASIDTPKVNFNYSADPCVPLRISLNGIVATRGSYDLDSIVRYNWIIDNGSTLSGENITVDLQPGTHSITFRAMNAGTIERSVTKQVFVGDTSKIRVQLTSITPGPSCSDSAHLSASVTGNNNNYIVSWSNGISNRLTTTVSRSGQYIAYLKDTCGNIRASDTLQIELNDSLIVSIRQSSDTLYSSLSKYTSASNPTYIWKWYRNDTLLSGQTLSYIVPVQSGTYKVLAGSSLGCTVVSVPLNYTIQVPPKPKVVRYTYEISPCNRQVYTFTGSISGIDSIADYAWIMNGNSWHTMNFNYEFTPGFHIVTFSVTDIHGDTTNWTSQLVVEAALPWTAHIANETLACSDTAILTANSTPAAAAYLWNTGDTSRTIRVTTSARYYLQVKDSCNTIRAADSIDVVIHPLAKATITHSGDTLIASAGSSYNWYLNNVVLNTHQQLLFPTATGSYKVAITNAEGCTSTSAPFIYTVPPPDTVAIGTITDSTLNVSAGFDHNFNPDNIFTAELTLDNNGGRTTGLQPGEVISLGSINSSNGNVAMQVVIPDSLACASNYVIRIRASSPADTTIWSKQFTVVNQPAQPVITQRGDSLFTSGIYNWQWYKNNVAIDGATGAYYRARANANYTVEANNGTGCKSMSSAVTVVITAVGEVTLGSNTAKVFPNPSEGQVYLQFSKPLLKTVTIKVYDLKGLVRYSRTTQQQLQQMDLSHLPKGIYMIALSGYGTQKALTIVLQ
jgi:PKD repeat protein